jgi:hypothetical protein
VQGGAVVTHSTLAGPYDLRGPCLKMPRLPRWDDAPDLDVPTVAQIVTLVVANAELAVPVDGLTWWQEYNPSERRWPWLEADAALRLVAAANPKTMIVEERHNPHALYLIRLPGCAQIATVYYAEQSGKAVAK